MYNYIYSFLIRVYFHEKKRHSNVGNDCFDQRGKGSASAAGVQRMREKKIYWLKIKWSEWPIMNAFSLD